MKESLARGEMVVLVRFLIDLIGSQSKILRTNQIDLKRTKTTISPRAKDSFTNFLH